jgi:type I restriction-modification system DNA methylase subunit
MTKKVNENRAIQDSLPELADSLVMGTRDLLREAKTEEDLRIGFEKLLDPIKAQLGLHSTPKYEKSVYSGGRSDAVHGQVIIEYEPPLSFSSKRNIDHAYDQLVNYLSDEAIEAELTQLVGVGFDGDQIFFVKYQNGDSKNIDRNKFVMRGPFFFNPESARTFLITLRALSRMPLTAENLAQKFGPQSELAPKTVSALANALEYWGNQTHIRTFFNEWKRIFGIVYGEQFNDGNQGKEAEALSKLYHVGRDTDFQELLFCVHTYFALLMKLIAAELLSLRETAFTSSLTSDLVHASNDELKRQIEDIENGGIYARKGITNFLEGDFFRWYLDAFDSPELRDAIREVARGLSEFEPATSTIDPISTRDLLKKLYQYLVPQEVRHRLGEYYTPDWLAELLLNEVGYHGNTRKRFLDPACGSGTFLVLAIQRAKEQGQKENLPSIEIAKSIVNNIWGFDLNPMAVIAARTNYLFAMGDLVNELPQLEIPIYLTDSVLTPTSTKTDLFGEVLEVSTSVGIFRIPAEWVRNGGTLLTIAAPLVEEMVKNHYSTDEALERFKTEGLVFSTNEDIVRDFYDQLLKLENENKNGIWARFLKNSFAPMIAGKFDFVVGNPPWIRWDYLSQSYRNATLRLWKDYGLFSLKGYAQMLGGAKPDFSMLFVYAASDYYLKNGGKLGFLITQEVFKSKGAGEGFRRFQLGNGEYLKVLQALDFVSIQPFEGATNKTAAIILKKGKKTEYPVPYIVWEKTKSTGKISTDKALVEVLSLINGKVYKAKPIDSSISAWQTYRDETEKLLNLKGINYYRARSGAYTSPYGVFWVEIKQVLNNNNLIISNNTKQGKKKIYSVEETIESDLVFPVVRGSDVKRWKADLKIFSLIVNGSNNMISGFDERLMKKNWPRTYNYLTQFKDDLISQAAYKRYHQDQQHPFYSQYNIGTYTFANYKVIWNQMGNEINSCVISQINTPFGFKMVIPLHTTALIASENELEAHYLCSIINSIPVKEFIKSFSSKGRGIGTPSVMDHVGIPKFDPQNALHLKLAEISKQCHQLKLEGKDEEIKKLEKENDALVEELFGISHE